MIYKAPCVTLFMQAASVTRASGWEGVRPWKSRVFWTL
jgi:hypothetical protein